MDILTKMIKTKNEINNLIFEEFQKYCKNKGINHENFYNEKNKQNLYNIIYDFIDCNFEEYKKDRKQIHVKNESRYIRQYLESLYIDTLPF